MKGSSRTSAPAVRSRRERILFTPKSILRGAARVVWTGRGWAFRAMIAIGGLFGFATLVWFITPPDVELCWIDSNDGLPVAAALPAERLMPMNNMADLYRHRVRLPLRLGIRNRSWAPLNDVTVTLEYPHLIVQSAARLLASRDSSVIMEHTLGLLSPGKAYTPIVDADEVLIPVDSLLSGALTVDGASLPQYIEFTQKWPQQADTSHVLLGVVARVSADGKMFEHAQQLAVPIWLEQQGWWPPNILMKERPASKSETALFAALFQNDQNDTLFSGAMTTRKTGRRVRWLCVKNALGHFSEYSVDGIPVRVQADTNSDWLVDFELLSRPAGHGRVTVTTYTSPRPMDMPMVHTLLRPSLPGEVVVPVSRVHLKD